MKTKIISLLVLTLCYGLQAQILFDDFNSTSVNTSLWNVVLPFSQSQVSESGSYLTTAGRGILATAAGFNSPYTVSGAVQLNNGLEHFGTVLRSDLTTSTASGLSQYYVLTGIYVEFSADGNQVSIQQIDASDPNPPILAEASFDFTLGQLYDFSITDMGSSVSLSINGTDLLLAATSFGTGDLIAFQSREFSATSSSLDFVRVSPVPEPSSLVLTVVGLVGLVGMMKKRS
jgi:hypothetical protein